MKTKYIFIGLVGYATSGKDYFADSLISVRRRNEEFTTFVKGSYSDFVWDVLLAIDPIIYNPGAEKNHPRLSEYMHKLGGEEEGHRVIAKRNGEVRRLLQRTGTEYGRGLNGPYYWADKLSQSFKNDIDRIERIMSQVAKPKKPENEITRTHVMISVNVRFPEELFSLMELSNEYGEMHLVDITRTGVGPVNNHISECFIEIFRRFCNCSIVNDSTSAYNNECLKLFGSIFKGETAPFNHSYDNAMYISADVLRSLRYEAEVRKHRWLSAPQQEQP